MKLSNYTIFSATVIILIAVVITATTMRLSENHEEKMIYAMHSKVEYYAKKCFLEEKCKNTVTLNDLYELKYLEEVVDPVSREVIDPNLKIEYKDNQVVINWQ